jgi:hypothetical protein
MVQQRVKHAAQHAPLRLSILRDVVATLWLANAVCCSLVGRCMVCRRRRSGRSVGSCVGSCAVCVGPGSSAMGIIGISGRGRHDAGGRRRLAGPSIASGLDALKLALGQCPVHGHRPLAHSLCQ